MDITYEYYKVFYWVAKCRSISGAAIILQKGQPNLTKIIRNLEAQLGCRLFLRNSRGVMLTPEGERLYQHISVAVEQIQAGEQALLADRSLQDGTVTIASSEIALRLCLLPVLESYRKQYPGVKIRLSNLSGPQAIQTVLAKTADFAVVTGPLDIPAELQVRQVGIVQQVAAGGKKYRPLGQKTIPLSQLAALPLVSMHPGTVSFHFLDHFFKANHTSWNPEIEVATADQLLPVIRSNLAVGFIPEAFLQNEDEIYPLQLQEKVPKQDILLIYPSDAILSPAAKKLTDMLHAIS